MVLVFLSVAAGALPNDRRLVPVDSDVYRLLRMVRLEAGLSVPWSSRSLTVADVERQLAPAREAGLSPAGMRAVAEIERLLGVTPVYESPEEQFAFALPGAVTLEGFANTADTEEEWLYPFRRRSPLLALPFEAWVGDSAYARLDIDLRHAKFATLELNRPVNIPLSIEEIDYLFPYRGYGFLGTDQLFLQLGRDQFHWGSARTGTLVLSDEADYYDALRFGFGVDRFRFTQFVAYLDPWLTPEERQALDPGAPNAPTREQAKTLFFSRIELDLPGSVQIGLVEGLIYRDAQPDLRLFNPLNIYHSYFEGSRGSSILGLEVNWAPTRFVNLYGEYAMMQVTTPFKASTIANSLGFLGGVETSVPVGQGFASGYAEVVYTNPWYGIRETPVASWHWRRQIRPNFGDLGDQIVTVPIGYAYGPDSLVFGFGAGYEVPGLYRVALDMVVARLGEQTIETPYERSFEAQALRTPTGIVEERITAELHGEYHPPQWPSVTTGGRIGFVNARNHRNVAGDHFLDFQISPFLRVSF